MKIIQTVTDTLHDIDLTMDIHLDVDIEGLYIFSLDEWIRLDIDTESSLMRHR